jgi:hypothetical protein
LVTVMVMRNVDDHRRPRLCRNRSAVASLEVVLATAVALPLAVLMFLLGVQICRYVFRGFDGMLTMPWL